MYYVSSNLRKIIMSDLKKDVTKSARITQSHADKLKLILKDGNTSDRWSFSDWVRLKIEKARLKGG